jgi:hypothetical protein
MQNVKKGDHVVVVDSVGKRHDALITNLFVVRDENGKMMSVEEYKAKYNMYPSINAVYVSDDESRTDSYGQQIERFTSFPHRSAQPATNGFFWLSPDET